MSRVIEIHNEILAAAINPNLTDSEYLEIMNRGLNEMELIGINPQELLKIGEDISTALALLMG